MTAYESSLHPRRDLAAAAKERSNDDRFSFFLGVRGGLIARCDPLTPHAEAQSIESLEDSIDKSPARIRDT
jgi:hypothetical protein